MKFRLPVGVYGITSEEHSRGRQNADVAREMVRGGASVVQYREKGDKPMSAMLEECLEIRKITRDSGVLFLVNDRIDLALASDADGVHLGQDDMPLAAARKILGEKIIGLSTHSPEQALKAVKDGADYIGVGPVFRTFTKKDVCEPVGLEYLDFVVKNIRLPFVAIGGIKKNNIAEVLKHGAKTIALVTEIVGADDIEGAVRELRDVMI